MKNNTLLKALLIISTSALLMSQGGFIELPSCGGNPNSSDTLITVPPPDSTMLSILDNQITEKNSLIAFPNPFNATTTIDINIPLFESNCIVYMYDITGKEVMSKMIQNNDTFILDGSHYSAGTYIIILMSNSSIISNTKITLLK